VSVRVNIVHWGDPCPGGPAAREPCCRSAVYRRSGNQGGSRNHRIPVIQFRRPAVGEHIPSGRTQNTSTIPGAGQAAKLVSREGSFPDS
jgi:hypothetical protein